MEARARLARASRVALRSLVWVGVGAAAIVVVAWWASPRWVEFCSRFSRRPAPCAPIATPRMIGYVSTGAGLLLMTIGPVVTTMWRLFRDGYNWETSRVEPAHVNLPIVFGLAYFIGGMLVVSVV
jgi:hypothetical protein